MTGLIIRLLTEDQGQDLVEYALLSGFIGVCAILAWQNIPPAIAFVYNSWDGSVQNLSSCTPNPGGGGC